MQNTYRRCQKCLLFCFSHFLPRPGQFPTKIVRSSLTKNENKAVRILFRNTFSRLSRASASGREAFVHYESAAREIGPSHGPLVDRKKNVVLFRSQQPIDVDCAFGIGISRGPLVLGQSLSVYCAATSVAFRLWLYESFKGLVPICSGFFPIKLNARFNRTENVLMKVSDTTHSSIFRIRLWSGKTAIFVRVESYNIDNRKPFMIGKPDK